MKRHWEPTKEEVKAWMEKAKNLPTIPITDLPDIVKMGELPTAGYFINCCDTKTAADKVEKALVDNKVWLRVQGICSECKRRNSQAISLER